MLPKPPWCAGCPLASTGKGFVPANSLDSEPVLLIQGEAPGQQEVAEGKPFVGRAGWWLRHNILEPAGVDPERVVYDNTLRCLPPKQGNGAAYPPAKIRDAAEKCCRAYDCWDKYPRVPLLLFGGNAARQRLGVSPVSDWHGHMELREEGGWVGVTFHPAAVLRDPALLPVVVAEVRNLMRRRAQGKAPERPAVLKGTSDMPSLRGVPFVCDLEWTWEDGDSETTVVGVAVSGHAAYSTWNTECALALVREGMASGSTIIGHNVIDADIPRIGEPLSYESEHVFDTLLAAHLVHHHLASSGDDSGPGHGLLGLGSLCRMLLGVPDWKHNRADLLYYNGLDCAYNYRLYQALKRDLAATRQEHLLGPAQRLAKIARDMHQTGVRIDRELACQMIGQHKEQVRAIDAKLPFNPRSPKQMREWFSERGVTLSDTTRAGIAKKAAQHPELKEVFDLLLELKDDWKPLTTWLPAEVIEAGRAYPTFNVAGTSVGRFCIAPDTLIECPRNLETHPQGVPLRDLRVGDWVYSLDWERRLCLRRIKWIGPTGVKPVLRFTVRSRWGELSSFKVTAEHLVRMFQGHWRSAGELRAGQKLCGMPRRGIQEAHGLKYAHFFPSSTRRKRGESGGRVKEHRWIWAQVHGRANMPARWDVHHRDGNPLNNCVNNLDCVPHTSHTRMHHPGHTREEIVRFLREPETWPHHRKTLRRYARKFGLATNHTIVSIESCEAEEVWDLEVEDTHTVIGGGVALHNSSASPNFQNLPPRLRRLLLPPEGAQWVAIDYSQLENRMIAFLAGDKTALADYASGLDVHRLTASRIHGKPVGEVTAAERHQAKTVVHATGYCETAPHLAERLYGSRKWADVARAKQLQEAYLNAYPGIYRWHRALGARMERGEIALRNPFGRWRCIYAPNPHERLKRAAHFLACSSGADLMNSRLLALHDELGITPALIVHDEVVFAAPLGAEGVALARAAARIMMRPSEQLDGLVVPVEIAMGENYGKASEENPHGLRRIADEG